MMMKNLLQIYALLVCFVTTIILIITLSVALNKLTDVFIPEYVYHSSLQPFNSDEDYIQYHDQREKDSLRVFNSDNTTFSVVNKEKEQGDKVASLKKLSPAQLGEKRATERKQFLEEKKVDNITSLISTFQWTLVALMFFFLHWRIYKKSKE